MRIVNRFAEHVRIKERNEGRKITQRDIASETGITTNTIGRLLRNEVQRPDLEVASTLCEWLGIHPSEFLTWSSSSSEEDDEKEIEALLAIPA